MIVITNNSSFNNKMENKKDEEIPPGLLLNYPLDLTTHPHWAPPSPISEPSISILMIAGTFIVVAAVKVRKFLSHSRIKF